MEAVIAHCVREGYGKRSRWSDENTVYIYCGRPSRLGNPYAIGRDGDRQTVCEKCWRDERWLREVERLIEWLKKKQPKQVILGCWCAPKMCHTEEIARRIREL